MGSIYALVALGIALIYSAVSILNFAQGEMVILGAYLGLFFFVSLGIPYFFSFLLVILFMGVVGYLFQKAVYYPLRNRHFLAVLVGTIGTATFMQESVKIVWGPIPLFFPLLFGSSVVKIGPVRVVPQHILILTLSTSLMVFLFFFQKTSLGRKMRATAQDKEAAGLLGVNTRRMIALTFIMSSSIAGIAGILLGPLFFLTPYMGLSITVKSLSGTIIGGFGSIPGAILGGLFVGLAEILCAAYISSTYKDVFVFLILILFLILRPQGILGERVYERA
jgi:branched-chain amino acid transport system permease protein